MSAPLLSGGAGWAAEQSVAADGPLRGPPLNWSVRCGKGEFLLERMRMDAGSQSYADCYDKEAEAVAWHGPAVVFGLMYHYIEAGQSLLDIGIGTGLGSVPFARAGLHVFGMDNSSAMLDGARSKGFARDLRDHDMMSVPYPYDRGSFDHAICVGALQFFAGLELSSFLSHHSLPRCLHILRCRLSPSGFSHGA